MKSREISSTLGYINLIYIFIPGLQYYVNHFTPTEPMCHVNVESQFRLLEKRAYFPLWGGQAGDCSMNREKHILDVCSTERSDRAKMEKVKIL